MTTTELVRTRDLLASSGLTSRQLSYWIVRGALCPSAAPAGQGIPLEWAPSEVDTARLLRRLLEAGLQGKAIESTLATLRGAVPDDPALEVFLGDGLWLTVTRGL